MVIKILLLEILARQLCRWARAELRQKKIT